LRRGDVCCECEDEKAIADAIYCETFTLALEALDDANVTCVMARRIADEVARTFG